MENIKVRVWGDYACFARPEMKVDRVTYDIITPSAAKGILDSIYWKPAMQWKIRKIHIINPIRYMNIRRNEVNDVMGSKPINISNSKNRTQRSAIILRDVHYVIEAEICLVEEEKGIGDNINKHRECAIRRLSKGEYFQKPFFGAREYACHFELLEDGAPIPESHHEWKDKEINLGYILHDQGYYHVRKIPSKKGKNNKDPNIKDIDYLKNLLKMCYFIDRNTGELIDNSFVKNIYMNKESP
ncbi:MAG: type I-C CRISPR-associated protein Cas5c [Candidatus Cloacimonetes bacterium]|nr:type I-C CRISPR-associated protein Cas5c [Candidatus Cloacimonadota bacterium]